MVLGDPKQIKDLECDTSEFTGLLRSVVRSLFTCDQVEFEGGACVIRGAAAIYDRR